MNLKKTFFIKGKEWGLEYKWSLKSPDRERVDGLCEFSSRTIFIDRLLSKEDKWSVFLHELIHATLYEAHLHDGSGLGSETEEIICDSLEDTFNSLFAFRWKRT